MLHDDSIGLLFRLFVHDIDTAYHCCRVAGMVEKMSNYMNVSASSMEIYFSAALLHDIGKSAIRSNILCAARPLTDEERDEMKWHSVMGEDLARYYHYPEEVQRLIRWHHERLDGSGYPDGLCGDSVSQGVRLIGLCDSVDAMVGYRPYRQADTREACLQKLEKDAPMFDSSLVELLTEHWDEVVRPK